MLSIFSKKPKFTKFPYGTDVHSHLLPGIDDGVATPEDAINVIRGLMELGFTRFITTPHINDLYKNDAARIHDAWNRLKPHLDKEGIHVPMEIAAEY